jgi:formate dehydrogenase formation protein
VVSRDYQALIARARLLASRYPAAAEVLDFYVELLRIEQRGSSPEELGTFPVELLDRVSQRSQACREHQPQYGLLRPEGNGLALSLGCGICSEEWPMPRGECPACGETAADKISYYSAEQYPHIMVQACESCRRYFHCVNLEKDPHALAEVDELAALPLDVWAREQGFTKLMPNLAGM